MYTLSPVRYDGWTIHLTALHDLTGEIFDPPTRTVLIDPTGCGLEAAAAHAVGHLRLKHHLTSGDFTEVQCDEADEEAERMLRGCTWQLLAVDADLAVLGTA